jgi:acetyltransferase-like isoleucine patch superfamily enzyme
MIPATNPSQLSSGESRKDHGADDCSAGGPAHRAESAESRVQRRPAGLSLARSLRWIAHVRVGWASVVFIGLVRYATNHIIAHIPSYTLRHAWYRHVWGWQIDRGASVLMGQRLIAGGHRWSRGKVTIGEDSALNHGGVLMPFVPIRIGKHVSISAGVSLITGGHDIEDPSFGPLAAPITVEDYAWIGMHATILGGVTIGKGAVVAAGALVWKDVPPFAVVAGAPARVVKRRTLENPSYSLNFRPLFE